MPPQGLGALHAQQTGTQAQFSKESATTKEQSGKQVAHEKKLQVPTTGSPFSGPAPSTPSKVTLRHHDSGNHSNAEGASENAEREQRRRQRVEKKLSEMQREESQEQRSSRPDGGAGQTAAPAPKPELSMVEFAQLHFAKHPKEFYQSSQTQVMRTLTRRRRTLVANSEAVPAEEMVTFCKAGLIPSPHLASINDSELLQLSVSHFKDLCKFVRGESTPEGEVLFIQTACQLAIEHEPLKDELLVQAVRQATANPLGHEALRRCWLLIAASIGCFKPTKTFHKVSTQTMWIWFD